MTSLYLTLYARQEFSPDPFQHAEVELLMMNNYNVGIFIEEEWPAIITKNLCLNCLLILLAATRSSEEEKRIINRFRCSGSIYPTWKWLTEDEPGFMRSNFLAKIKRIIKLSKNMNNLVVGDREKKLLSLDAMFPVQETIRREKTSEVAIIEQEAVLTANDQELIEENVFDYLIELFRIYIDDQQLASVSTIETRTSESSVIY